jgi:hypothetical protein
MKANVLLGDCKVERQHGEDRDNPCGSVAKFARCFLIARILRYACRKDYKQCFRYED